MKPVDVEIIDFSDIEPLEESIAPVFVAALFSGNGGTCGRFGCLCLA